MLVVPPNAPEWVGEFARRIDAQSLDALLRLFVSVTPYTVANKPSAAAHAWKLIFLSDGAANKFLAVSNGSAWYYMEGTAV